MGKIYMFNLGVTRKLGSHSKERFRQLRPVNTLYEAHVMKLL